MSSTTSMWNEQFPWPTGYLPGPRPTVPLDSSAFHNDSLVLESDPSVSHFVSPSSTLALPEYSTHTLPFHRSSTLPEPPSVETNNAERNRISQDHVASINGPVGPVSIASDDESDGVHASTNDAKPAKKRKAADMEILVGKKLIDTYGKRSGTVLEKAMELEKLTGAYVVIYTARPESIGNGNYRLYMSDNLRNGNCSLSKDISGAVDAIETASKAAYQPRRGGRNGKKRRTENSLDCEAGPSMQRTSDTNVTSTNPSQKFTSGNIQSSIEPPAKVLTCHHATSITAVTPASSSISLDNGSAHQTTTDTGTICVPIEKSDISSLVHLLKSNSRDVQLYGLAIIRKLVESDYSTQVHDSELIPPLVKLLERTPAFDYDVTYQSVVILSQMAQYFRPCRTMVIAGIIPSLSRLLSPPISDTMSATVARLTGQCADQHQYYRAFQTLFPKDILQPLINLLDSGEKEVCIAAAIATGHIARSECPEVMRHLRDERVVPQLCCLFSKCTDIFELEQVALAIGQIGYGCSDGDNEDIGRFVLRPLVDLLGHGKDDVKIGAARALKEVSRCCDYDSMDFFAKTIVHPHIVPLISSDKDRLFLEALSCAVHWTIGHGDDFDCGYMPGYLSVSVLSRLLDLLSFREDEVTVSAALIISKVTAFSSSESSNYPEIIDHNRARVLVGFLSSKNMEVVRAMAEVLQNTYRRREIGHLLRSDVVPALVNALTLAFDSQRTLKAIMEAMSWIEECIADSYDLEDLEGIAASDLEVQESFILRVATPYFVRFLSLGEDFKFVRVFDITSIVSRLVRSSHTACITFLDAGGVRAFTRCLLAHTPDEYAGINCLLLFARHSFKSRQEMRAAGAEGILSGYLANTPAWSDRSDQAEAEEALELLRSDPAGQTGQWLVE